MEKGTFVIKGTKRQEAKSEQMGGGGKANHMKLTIGIQTT